MGRILAQRYGFKASVFFTLDDEGFIEPGSSNIAGLEALETADLMVVGLQFQDFPAAEIWMPTRRTQASWSTPCTASSG